MRYVKRCCPPCTKGQGDKRKMTGTPDSASVSERRTRPVTKSGLLYKGMRRTTNGFAGSSCRHLNIQIYGGIQ